MRYLLLDASKSDHDDQKLRRDASQHTKRRVNMELSDAVEMVVFCTRSFVDPEDDGCKVCPLQITDEEGVHACDHLRLAAWIIGDSLFA